MIVKPQHVVAIRHPRLGGCPAIFARLQGGLDLMSLHLENLEEQRRILQAKHALRQLGGTAVVIGEAMVLENTNVPQSDVPQSRPPRRAALLARRLLPSIELSAGHLPWLRRVDSLARQTAEPADDVTDATTQAFLEAGFENACKDHVSAIQEGLPRAEGSQVLYRGTLRLLSRLGWMRLAVCRITSVFVPSLLI